MSADTVDITDAARTLATAIEQAGIDPTQPLTRPRFAQEIAMRIAPALIADGCDDTETATRAATVARLLADELRGFH